MSAVHSFEPLIGTNPKILILGSMPGAISLQAAQYYGNPHNAFWPIMAELFGVDSNQAYAKRIHQIYQLPVIIWDTLKTCHRAGSLDSSIQQHQLEANNIPVLLRQFPHIILIAFNGAAAEKYFKQLVKPSLPDDRRIDMIRLPSTSPANAGMRFADKLAAWRQLLDYV